jgi:hypothetical protein
MKRRKRASACGAHCALASGSGSLEAELLVIF